MHFVAEMGITKDAGSLASVEGVGLVGIQQHHQYLAHSVGIYDQVDCNEDFRAVALV